MASNSEFSEMVENWAKHYFFQSLTEFFNYLKLSELSLLQGYALTYLYFKGPIKISDLCDHMTVSMGAASQMVDRLEKLDMVDRIADPNDRRVRKIRVRTKGRRFVQANFAFSQSWMGAIPSEISSEQEAQITTALSILMQSINTNEITPIND
ncbi:MAG: MarR family transcriptional regulator [Anaerolineae bacterium]|nr:MarR family transcriptional regulator [Anaerolineae bacterium]